MDQQARRRRCWRWAVVFGLVVGGLLFPVSFMMGEGIRAAIELNEPWARLSDSPDSAEIESALETVARRNQAEVTALRVEFMGYLMASLTLGAVAFTWAIRERGLSCPHPSDRA